MGVAAEGVQVTYRQHVWGQGKGLAAERDA